MKTDSLTIKFYWSDTTKTWTIMGQLPSGARLHRRVESSVGIDAPVARLLMSGLAHDLEALLPIR